MGSVFLHSAFVEVDHRIDEIQFYIVNFFQGKIKPDDTFFILDPYLDPYEMIYEPLQKKMIDSSPYLKILYELYESQSSIGFKIITDMNLTILKNSLPKEERDRHLYAKFFIENEKGRIEILRYPSKSSKYPDKLHDRWIILKSADHVCGLHLGPSLGDYSEKDFTITTFNCDSAKTAEQRFEEIWHRYVGREK